MGPLLASPARLHVVTLVTLWTLVVMNISQPACTLPGATPDTAEPAAHWRVVAVQLFGRAAEAHGGRIDG